MQTLLKIFALIGAITLLTGCETRTVILDSNADVVRLGPNVRGKIYVWRDGKWTLTGKTTLPEGWFAGPGPKSNRAITGSQLLDQAEKLIELQDTTADPETQKAISAVRDQVLKEAGRRIEKALAESTRQYDAVFPGYRRKLSEIGQLAHEDAMKEIFGK